MSNKKTLQPGDVIYKMYGNAVNSRHEIERVTEKTAFINNGTTKFKIEYTAENCLSEIGRDTWDSARYYIETPQLKARYIRRELVFDVDSLMKSNIGRLSIEQLNQILTVLKNETA